MRDSLCRNKACHVLNVINCAFHPRECIFHCSGERYHYWKSSYLREDTHIVHYFKMNSLANAFCKYLLHSSTETLQSLHVVFFPTLELHKRKGHLPFYSEVDEISAASLCVDLQ